jgi:hypothetical protein
MKRRQINLGGFLLWSAAVPMWGYAVWMIAYSEHPLGAVAGVLSLGIAAAAIRWLIRDWANAWAIAAVVAPLAIFLPLLVIATLTAN